MSDTDVLIVGAGPTGLTAAAELLRRGLSVRLIDRNDAPTTLSKAIAIHARTLEILHDVGVAETLIERGVRLNGVTMWANGDVVVSASFDELETSYPFILSIAQAESEKVLLAKVEELGGKVERSVELVGLRQDGSGVSATLETKAGPETTRVAWLIGADGAHSTVRKLLEIPFEGNTYDDRFLLADVRIGWDVRDDRIATYFSEDGLMACFPMAGGRWRLIASASGDGEAAPELAEVQKLFATRTRTDAVLEDPQWLARFRIHCRQVERYRDDRVFLCGDAAHVHSPAGGQGMNAGIQDAHNLAWKLALVHRGSGRGLLLDSYQTERHAAGAAILRGTDMATKVGTLKSSAAKAVRNSLARMLTGFEFVQQRITRQVAELTVAYESSPIVREDRYSLLQSRIGSAAGGETPTVGTRRDFDEGPRPGARAPDGKITVAGESGTKRLADVLDGRRHTLLLFDGRSDSDEGYQRFAEIVAAVDERFPELVSARVVTPKGKRPAALPESMMVILDPDGDLERVYGAGTECAYLIRPDLYVGYRAQPASVEKIVEYLKTILR